MWNFLARTLETHKCATPCPEPWNNSVHTDHIKRPGSSGRTYRKHTTLYHTNQCKQWTKTCIHYKTNRCKHGISGKNCDYRHPKPCKKCMTFGDKARNGCSKGRTCEFLHPKVCRTSINKHECFNDNCKFMHIKGTKRQKPINENITGQTNPPKNPRKLNQCWSMSHPTQPGNNPIYATAKL